MNDLNKMKKCFLKKTVSLIIFWTNVGNQKITIYD